MVYFVSAQSSKPHPALNKHRPDHRLTYQIQYGHSIVSVQSWSPKGPWPWPTNIQVTQTSQWLTWGSELHQCGMNCDKKLGFDSRVLFDCHLDLVLLDSCKRASQSVVARTAHAGFVFRPRNFHLMVLWSILSYCRSALVMPGSLSLHTFVSRLDFTCLSIDI